MKKMTRMSFYLMLLSTLIMMVIAYLNSSLDFINIDFKLEKAINIKNFFLEINEIFMLISIFFVLLLALLELISNSNNFDIYFVSIGKKPQIIIAKIVAYSLIILFYLLLNYFGIIIIYLIRFKIHYFFKEISLLFIFHFFFLEILFLFSLLLINITHNYFVVLVPIGLYWMAKIDFSIKYNQIFHYVFLNLNYVYEKIAFDFMTPNYYPIIYYLFLFFLNVLLYSNQDIKT